MSGHDNRIDIHACLIRWVAAIASYPLRSLYAAPGSQNDGLPSDNFPSALSSERQAGSMAPPPLAAHDILT